jgi:DNA repair protein RecO
MRQVFTTKAIVLNKRPLLNNNLLLTLFSETLGKINVFAFGIRKITSRRLSYFQIANFLRVVVEKKEERFILEEVALISAFSSIKEDKTKWGYLYQFFYILNKILPENVKDEKNFSLTLEFLVNLAKKKKDFDFNFFLNKLLFNLGYLTKKQSLFKNLKMVEEIIEEKLPNFSL